MPEVHLPHLDEDHADSAAGQPAGDAVAGDGGTNGAPAAPPPARHHRPSLVTILLEVVLISTGVFLGLLGEQWREHSQHRELARTALDRLRVEVATNQKAVA